MKTYFILPKKEKKWSKHLKLYQNNFNIDIVMVGGAHNIA